MSDFNKFDNMKFGIDPRYINIQWGKKKDIKPFIDKNPFNNLILSKTEQLTMNRRKGKRKNPLYQNSNVAVVGCCGSGKTFNVIKPNIYQLRNSYIVLDTKGVLLHDTGNLFMKNGYNLNVLNSVDIKNSMHFNPFAYIKSESDISNMADMLFKCLDYDKSACCPFFKQASVIWLVATIGYLYYEVPLKDRNILRLVEILDNEILDIESGKKNRIDGMFAELEQKDPKHYAVKSRKNYMRVVKNSAVSQSVLKLLHDCLSPFDDPEVAALMSYDELYFDTYGDAGQKSILYVIISDTNTTYNFIVRLLFTQMFSVLCNKADERLNGRLATPVQFILDDVVKIGEIYKFETFSTIMGRRSMSFIMTMQKMSQLEEIYKDKAEIIIGNCGSIIYTSNQDIPLWFVSKVSMLPRHKCIVRISGLPPFFSDVYDTTKHPNYKYTADYDERNAFCFVRDNDQYKVVI